MSPDKNDNSVTKKEKRMDIGRQVAVSVIAETVIAGTKETGCVEGLVANTDHLLAMRWQALEPQADIVLPHILLWDASPQTSQGVFSPKNVLKIKLLYCN